MSTYSEEYSNKHLGLKGDFSIKKISKQEFIDIFEKEIDDSLGLPF